jgi:DNA polymerase-3 subunit gamma/tau
MSTPAEQSNTSGTGQRYVVIARRYRPQAFDELLGQEHVAQALKNAIATGRVGHAYLFTGARGVGKTSAARILAKALNCETGPTPVPCNRCDICRSISGGDDVDVLEIDGASNRGIDEIRQLRQNANVRPSRARFKIYIIDEVHMLTREAFNALLKTLEEPPEHVKFIFCTTEPTKIPVTILSRCQRFDFAGIVTSAIARRLAQIVAAEGVEADAEALEVLARRAAGSMRDSQSLLEQLLAFSDGRISVDDVHSMLGTAGDQRLADLAGHLVARDAAAALGELDRALAEGVDPAQLLEQLFGYLRDCMAAAAGCPPETLMYVPSRRAADVAGIGRRLGMATILAVMQIIDHTLSRMRYSTQARILAELCLVRICHLEDLEDLAEVIGRLQSGGSPATAAPTGPQRAAASRPARSPTGPSGGLPSGGGPSGGAKKNADSPPSADGPAAKLSTAEPAQIVLSAENATAVWSAALGQLAGMVAEQARQFDKVSFDGANRLVVSFRGEYALAKATCERPEQVARFQEALRSVTGQPVRVEFRLSQEAGGGGPAEQPARPLPQHLRLMEAAKHPLVHRATELFGARPVRVEDDEHCE